jgi:predicted Holliday junction resolvase-like endonuclease
MIPSVYSEKIPFKILQSKIHSKEKEVAMAKQKYRGLQSDIEDIRKEEKTKKREIQFLIYKMNEILEKKRLHCFQVSNDVIREKSVLKLIQLMPDY